MATPNSPTVLITGVNGYIGSAAVLEFISAGFRVRGTVRSIAKHLPSLTEAFQHHLDAGTLELVEIPDLLAPNAFDEAVKNVVGIAHIGIPGLRAEVNDPEKNLQEARDGIKSLLRSAEEHAGPQLRTVVIMSSFGAMMRMNDEPGYRYTGDEPNNMWYVDTALAMGKSAHEAITYTATKVAVEETFWALINDPARKERGSTFVGLSVNPSFVTGPVTVRPDDPRMLPASVERFWHVFGGGAWPAEYFKGFVDVRDVARACVVGVEKPKEVSGERLLLSAYRISDQAVADVLREAYPDRKDIIREGNPGEGYPSDFVTWGPEEVGTDARKYEQLAGRKYIPFKDCAIATAKSMEPYLEQGKDKELSDEVPVLRF